MPANSIKYAKSIFNITSKLYTEYLLNSFCIGVVFIKKKYRGYGIFEKILEIHINNNKIFERKLNTYVHVFSNNISAIALELLPRISRAQSSDALSSQANIAGYKSVLLAASALDRYFPMLMTAAGTIQPSKVVVLGAGVAGLQAIATAKRLGAVVYVSDIREAVKEQVESLGARFIELPKIDETPSESGGYAKQVSDEFIVAQRKELAKQLSEADVAICTAQVPGKKAPKLIDEKMLDDMRPGSVVIDLAVLSGGNCACSKPGETIVREGVKIIGASNLPCSIPNHASSLYSRNLLSLLQPMFKEGKFLIDNDDELIAGSLISKDGVILKSEIIENGGTRS